MIKNIIKKGFILKEQKLYKKALETFYEALTYSNESKEILFEIADLYYLLNHDEKAINYIEQIQKQDPLHIESMLLLKKIFEKNKDYCSIEKILKNIYDLTKSIKILEELLKILNIQKKYDELLAICENYDFSNININLEISIAYFNKNNLTISKEILEKNLLINNKHQDSIVLLGKIFLKYEDTDSLIKILASVDEQIKNPDLYNFLGLAEVYLKNYSNAQNYFLKAISIEKKQSEYYYNLANTYFQIKENKMAKKYYNTALALNPENNEYQLALANVYYSEKNYRNALKYLDNNNIEANILKANILCDMKYFALAQKIIQNIEQEEKSDIDIDVIKGRIEKALKFKN